MTEELSPRVTASAAARADRTLAQEISGYLRRYPELAESERSALIDGYRRLSNVDVAIISSDPDITPKLQQFRAENRGATREPFRNYAVLLALVVLGFALMAYLTMIAK